MSSSSIYEPTSNTPSDVEASAPGQDARDRVSRSVASSKATGVPYSDAELAAMQAQVQQRSACAFVLFVGAICLWCPWCSAPDMIAPCEHDLCDTDMSNNENASVWLGNGCFWHTQYDMVTVEQERPFSRLDSQVTSLVGYAGGLYTSPDGLVCYHGGPSGSLYEDLGHAEAVQVQLDRGQERTQFIHLLDKYFMSFRHTDDGMERLDPQDSGAPYRIMIGIPGGMEGKFLSIVQERNVNNMPLVQGGADGGRGDTEDEYQIYIYDSLVYHFYRAEAYHQFHTNNVLHRPVPSSYTNTLKDHQVQLGRIDPTGCPEGGMGF